MANKEVDKLKDFLVIASLCGPPFIGADLAYHHIKKHHPKSMLNTKLTHRILLASLAAFCWPRVFSTNI